MDQMHIQSILSEEDIEYLNNVPIEKHFDKNQNLYNLEGNYGLDELYETDDIFKQIVLKLLNVLSEFTDTDVDVVDIYQMFLLKYTKGSFAGNHSDNVFITTLTLLEECDVGGEMYIENVHIPLKKGETLILSGGIEHEIKEVIEGTRKVFVVWIR